MSVNNTKSRDQKSKQNNKYLWFLSYVLSNISSGLISPLIPLFVVLYLHSSVFYVGLASSIASIATVPALIFWGNLSDAIGKRKIFIVIGFIGSFASLLLVILAHMIWTYIGVLALFQFIAMAATPVSTLLILENTKKEEWAAMLAKFNWYSYIGLIIGLIAGTVLISAYASGSGTILPMLYVLSALVYLSAGISAILILPESVQKLKRSGLSIFSIRLVERIRYFPSSALHIISLKNLKKSKPLLPKTRNYIFITALLMLGFQVFFVPYPVYMIEKLKANENQIFIMYLLNNIFSAIGFKIANRYVTRFGLRKTISISLLARMLFIGVVAVIAFISISTVSILYLSILIYGLMGFTWSFIGLSWVTSVSKIALPENRGKAIGFYNSFLGIGQVSGAAISGWLAYYISYGFDFLAAIIIILIGAIIISSFYIHNPEIEKTTAT
jgi:MFS family permease